MVNNSTNATALLTNISSDHLLQPLILIPVLLIVVVSSALNLFTISIIIDSAKLRRAANYPIVSVLSGACLQSLFTVPTFVFKETHQIHTLSHPALICDLYRYAYFISAHIINVSLMVVSFDRMVAIKHPFRYKSIFTKKHVSVLMIICWISILAIDSIPFYPLGQISDYDGCTYIPKPIWRKLVVMIFNIVPFAVIFINYIIIWKVAAKMNCGDHNLKQNNRLTRQAEIKDTELRNKDNESEDEIAEYMFNTNDIRKHSDEFVDNLSNEESKCKPTDAFIECTPDIKGLHSYIEYTSRNEIQNKLNQCHEDSIPVKSETSKNSMTMFADAEKFEISEIRAKIAFACNMKANKTSFTLSVVYLICWAPLGIFYFIDTFCPNYIPDRSQLKREHVAVNVVGFLSSIFLPIVYCWRTKEFRKEA